MQEKILILDFGSQYTQLIARRVRELNVYCEIHPFNKFTLDESVRGVILSGSPYSVRDEKAPQIDLSAIKGHLPLLGVCYGAQYLSQNFGGEVAPSATREYGRAMLSKVDKENPLIRDLSDTTQVWMSHGDTIVRLPANCKIIASTEDVPVAAFEFEGEQTWGIQFHPEVYHSTEGSRLLKHFVVDICGCEQSWTPDSFIESTVRELREKIAAEDKARREQEQAIANAQADVAHAQSIIEQATEVHDHPEITESLAGSLARDKAEHAETEREVAQLEAAEDDVRERTRDSRIKFTGAIVCIIAVILVIVLIGLFASK